MKTYLLRTIIGGVGLQLATRKIQKKKELEKALSRRSQLSGKPWANIQTAIAEVLETVSLMRSSKNVTFIQEKAAFLKERLHILKTAYAASRSHYQTGLQHSFLQSTSSRPLAPVEGWQLELLTNPHDFDFELFYAKCLLIGFEAYYAEQLTFASSQGTDAAVRHRFSNLAKKLEEVNSVLSGLAAVQSVQRLLEQVRPELKAIEEVILSQEPAQAENASRLHYSISGLREKAHMCKEEGNYGLWRICEYKIEKHFYDIGATENAASQLLKCAYLDINGPNNTAGRDPEFYDEYYKLFGKEEERETFYFNPSARGKLAPDVVEKLASLLAQGHLAIAEAKTTFLKEAEPIHRELHTPVTPEKAWEVLSARLC